MVPDREFGKRDRVGTFESAFQNEYEEFTKALKKNNDRIDEIWRMDVPREVKEETIRKEHIGETKSGRFSKSRGSGMVAFVSEKVVYLDAASYASLKKETDKMGLSLDIERLGGFERYFSIKSGKREIIKAYLQNRTLIYFEPNDKYAYLSEMIDGLGK